MKEAKKPFYYTHTTVGMGMARQRQHTVKQHSVQWDWTLENQGFWKETGCLFAEGPCSLCPHWRDAGFWELTALYPHHHLAWLGHSSAVLQVPGGNMGHQKEPWLKSELCPLEKILNLSEFHLLFHKIRLVSHSGLCIQTKWDQIHEKCWTTS